MENKRSTRRRSYLLETIPFLDESRISLYSLFPSFLSSFLFFFHFRLDPDDGDVVNWISSTRGKLNLREASYILSTLSLRRQNSAIHRTGTPWTRGDNTTTIRWVWMRAPLHPICIINLGKRLSRHLSLTCG